MFYMICYCFIWNWSLLFINLAMQKRINHVICICLLSINGGYAKRAFRVAKSKLQPPSTVCNYWKLTWPRVLTLLRRSATATVCQPQIWHFVWNQISISILFARVWFCWKARKRPCSRTGPAGIYFYGEQCARVLNSLHWCTATLPDKYYFFIKTFFNLIFPRTTITRTF